MTVVVAFFCSDGVVVAADSMLTPVMGQIATGHNKGKKVHVVAGDQIFAFAGDQGQAERFKLLAENAGSHISASNHPMDYAILITQNIISQFTATGIGGSINLGTILAFVHDNRPVCCAFMGPLQPWLLDTDHYYVALGSGKQMADPFLRFLTDIFCPKQPSVREAVFMATWTIDHVIRTNPGGVAGPIRIGVIENGGSGLVARELNPTEVGEQEQAITSAAQALRDWRDLISGQANPNPAAQPPTRPDALSDQLS